MPPTADPRPRAKQYRSSGWAWPLLVNVQVQKEKKHSQARRQSKSPQHASAKPSMRDLRRSRDLTHLRDEQSEPTSPLHSPYSPRESSASGHHAEASEIVDAGLAGHDDRDVHDKHDKHPPEKGDDTHQDMPLPAEAVLEPETQHDENADDEPNSVPLPEEVTDELKAQPGQHHEKDVQYEPPEAKPVNELEKQDEEQDEHSLGSLAVEEGSRDEPEVQGGEHGENDLKNANTEDTTPPLAPTEQPSKSSSTAPVDISPEKHLTVLTPEAVVPEPFVPKETFFSDDRYPALISAEVEELEPVVSKEIPSKEDRYPALIPIKEKEPDKPRPNPIITIQRPSTSGISDSGEEDIPAAPLPTPEPQAVDVVLSKGRYVTNRLPLKERLEEERRITTELTPQDRERIVQEIASNIASLEPNPPDTKGLKPNVTVPANFRVKRRMKVRGKVVRGPMLKLLLGRELARPTKEALKLTALGRAAPAVPDVANAYSAVPHPSVRATADGNETPAASLMDNPGPSRAENSLPSQDIAGRALESTAAFDQLTLETIDSISTRESQQVWFGRRYQADFISSLPGIKQICRMLQHS